MSLTPKNWDTFQHYKDRAPAWIKLHRGLLDDYTFACLPVASRALAPLLWLLASEYEGGKITASDQEICFRLRMSEREYLGAVQHLIAKGFFIAASVVLADCKQDAIPEREREIEEQVEREIDIRAVAIATPSDDLFEEFLRSYPKRDGRNPREPARKKFFAAIKSGADARRIIAGAGKYRSECQSKQQIGTPFVAQMVTWLNQKSWSDYAAVVEVSSTDPPRAGLPSDEELRAKYGAKNGRDNGTADATEARSEHGQRDSDHAGKLLGEGSSAHRASVSGEGSDYIARKPGVRSLGQILQRSPALAALGAPSHGDGEYSGDDGPDAVARVV